MTSLALGYHSTVVSHYSHSPSASLSAPAPSPQTMTQAITKPLSASSTPINFGCPAVSYSLFLSSSPFYSTSFDLFLAQLFCFTPAVVDVRGCRRAYGLRNLIKSRSRGDTVREILIKRCRDAEDVSEENVNFCANLHLSLSCYVIVQYSHPQLLT